MQMEICLLFPHQLWKHHPALGHNQPVYLVEEFLFFRQYAFHKQKIILHRATMKAYASILLENGHTVTYIDSTETIADVRKLIPHLAASGVQTIHVADVVDDWLERRLVETARQHNIKLIWYNNPGFLLTKDDLKTIPEQTTYLQANFYQWQRKRLGILIDQHQKPIGGKWSFDADNRCRYPAEAIPPAIAYPETNEWVTEAQLYVKQYYSKNPGATDRFIYPVTHEAAQAWLMDFLNHRFPDFGRYEDAIVRDELILHHSLLSPLLNIGLLEPEPVLQAVLQHAERNDIPLASLEGLIRQLIGWREFIRLIYVRQGRTQRTRHYWTFNNPVAPSFYNGTTGIAPIDQTIGKVWQQAYCHHIERLMILGNYFLLLETNPDAVYQWFMEMFIDAFDWVMVPNVYGMSQFADGGLMCTKPYISGSNYIRKMSDYPKGNWEAVWDGLFWRFMSQQRSFFSGNPRLGMLLKTWDRFSEDKKLMHLKHAANEINKYKQAAVEPH
jgi:deoxyribodipyrimidine photolyase-related protein